eukprot:TRINITY_DN1147_c0_g1_i1.p1 TRINITY_DN1147_c0_g1~~TRINITY_DN1147_c0_g1_i1.p1  ORF type:complete len:239 (+),score=73.19 TRINITY_DN1147_c0_g1_i1:156-872(+)
MSRATLALFALAAALLVASVFSQSACPTTSPHQDTSYDFLLYVARWAGTTQTSDVPSYVNSFTLHGVWPTRNDSSYPSCCDNSDPFQSSSLNGILQPMREAWYDYQDGPNSTALWTHEWDKHGTCSKDVMSTQHTFFSTAVSLHTTIDVTTVLQASGIVPSKTAEYAYSDIVSALRKQLPFTPLITCSTAYKKTCLDTIEYCVDKFTFQLFECAPKVISSSKTNCPSKVYFPTINYES